MNRNTHWHLLSLLLSVCFVGFAAGCGKNAEGGDDGTTAPNRFIGTYQVIDVDNSFYDITIFPGGAAASNQTHGGMTPKGQLGHWIANDYRTLIYWDDKTVVSIYGVGTGFRKYFYTSDMSVTDDNPAQWSQALVVPAEKRPFVGVWAAPQPAASVVAASPKTRPPEPLSWDSNSRAAPMPEATLTYFALRSDGTASKSSDAKATGTWTVVDGVAAVVWSDGWNTRISGSVNGFTGQSFPPGVPASQPSRSGAMFTLLRGTPVLAK